MTTVGPALLPALETPPAPLRRTLRLARSERRRLVLATALDAATGGCAVALLATSAWLISRAAQRPSVVALGVAIVGVRFFAVARAVSRYAQRLLAHDTALRSLRDRRVQFYERLEPLAPTGLPAFRRGDLLARLVQDVDALQDLLVRVIPPYGSFLLVGVPAVALAWYFLPAAGVTLGIALLLTGFAVPWCTKTMAAGRERRREPVRGDLMTSVVDLIEGAPELVAFGADGEQLHRITRADGELTYLSHASSRTAAAGAGLQTLIVGLAIWVTLLAAVPAVRSGVLSGVMLAVVALLPLALLDTATLPAAAQAFEGVRRSAARVFEVLDTRPAVADPAHPAVLGPGPHVMRVRGLRARYGPAAPWVLDGVDLTLTPGRRVAIVGPSGAGKTTLAAVLLRLLPYEGSVTLDGIELSRLAGDDVRRVVGLGSQEPHIFDTTLRENLLLARRTASDTDLWDGLEHVSLAEWVRGLPAGLDTELGERGARMSGGQRHRLDLARCVLAGFPILILDEPTEHVEEDLAGPLLADLTRPAPDRTFVLITHRLSGLEDMDEILVLDEGRVVERGTHEELMETEAWYARQWRRERP